jgi:hypothetical protein
MVMKKIRVVNKKIALNFSGNLNTLTGGKR